MSVTSVAPTRAGATPHRQAASAALVLLALTSVHHAYGAVIYETPWRLHILGIAVPVAALIVALVYVRETHPNPTLGRVATGFLVVAILVFPVGVIGIFEGGYNHLLKNIVYFGMGADAAIAWFPPPDYEMPNDLVFELTGIAQFPVAVFAALHVPGMLRRGAR